MRQSVHTADAPRALGTYSQAIVAGNTVYLSGQIGLDPATGELADGFENQLHRVFRNLSAVAAEAGTNPNATVAPSFRAPYPSRTTVQVSALPKGARVEVDVILAKG